MSLNRVMIIGHLGQDPEIRYTPSGLPVVNISPATDEPSSRRRANRRNAHRGIESWPSGSSLLSVTSISQKGDRCSSKAFCVTQSGRTTSMVANSIAPRSLQAESRSWVHRCRNRILPRWMAHRCQAMRIFPFD